MLSDAESQPFEAFSPVKAKKRWVQAFEAFSPVKAKKRWAQPFEAFSPVKAKKRWVNNNINLELREPVLKQYFVLFNVNGILYNIYFKL